MTQSVKGWSDKGIAHSILLLIRQKRILREENPTFERRWLEANRSTQEEEGATAKKWKCYPSLAGSELFESDVETILHQLQMRHLWRSLEVRMVKKQIIYHKLIGKNGCHIYGWMMTYLLHSNHIIIQ
jgi:hypothetical protein